jgi:hypothetical protein
MFTKDIFKNILTQSSRRRGEQGVITNLCRLLHIFFIFIIKINMKEKSDFLITNGTLRPLRLCVKNLWSKIYDVRDN